ncbi:MAG: hypothetical protein JW809_02095 [Pirellulales bacterium]|nr:hypothetical protein [Pirellulales bacterium]
MAALRVSIPLLAVMALSLAGGCGRSVPPAAELPPIVDSDTLSETRVVATLDAPLESGKNIIFCGTFQLAWNELRGQMQGQPVQVEGDPAIAAALNAGTFSRNDLADDAYVALAGRVADGVYDRIKQALAGRFPAAAAPPAPRVDTEVYVYAYLEKRLPFAEVFDRLDRPLPFHVGEKTVEVRAFGIDLGASQGKRLRRLYSQVEVLDYKSDDDFILALLPESEADQIVLAKIPPEASLAETVRAVSARVGANAEGRGPLQQYESLAVPTVALGIAHRYADLIGQGLANPGWEHLLIMDAQQSVRFRLDEGGAALASEARGALTCAPDQHPRQFRFDRPFLLYLKEADAAAPYLAMWIETPEVLVRAE